MGRNDKNNDLKEFARGENVGHGVDHDCPACRKNRQALKLSGLKASDIKGLEGGKPPAGDAQGQPPQAATAFVPPVVGGGEVPEAFRPPALPATPMSPEPDPSSTAMVASAEGAQGIADADATNLSAVQAQLESQKGAGDGGEILTDQQRRAAQAFTNRHRRLVTLSCELDEAIIRESEKRGFNMAMLEPDDEEDLADAIIANGGRYMLMCGFRPDDRDWNCEVGIGSERAHVKHPNKQIAIRLAVLIALDPRNGARLNSQIMQLLAEERPQPAGQWTGLGVQP